MKPAAILSLISFFSVLSILSIGGSNSVVPEMARHAVEVEHWLTAAQFTNIFAISQAAPGPSNLIVALIGFKVAGFWGALVAQLAMTLPAAFIDAPSLAYLGGLFGKRFAPCPGAWACADCRRPHFRQRLDHCRRSQPFTDRLRGHGSMHDPLLEIPRQSNPHHRGGRHVRMDAMDLRRSVFGDNRFWG
jgi:hypothetical protein